MKPRRLQLEAMQMVDEILSGAEIRDILFMCTPGSGKSALPMIFGKLIQKRYADAICWICPRKSLQYQGEENFQDPFFRKMFGHNLSIRKSTNDVDPCRGLHGFVTTYSALGLDYKRTVLNEIRRKRYILIIDEGHHLEEDSLWEEAISPIYEAATYRIRMSGTLERNSGKRVAFTKYIKTDKGTRPDLSPDAERVVTYTRRDALAERAIIPLKFFFNDASVSWTEEDGQTKKYGSLFKVTPKDTGKAIYTAINTDYAKELIDKALDHFSAHKKKNPSARMLIVTPNISRAHEALGHLKSRFYEADIATSHETPAALEAIRRLKRGQIEILVGVAMFYEGFSCPEVSHIVSLTHIRSTPWIEQMLARAVRVSPALPYEQQYAYIFTMDDSRMHSIVKKIEAEQLPFINGNKPVVEQLGLFGGSELAEYKPYKIDPIESKLTNGYELTLGPHWPDLSQEIGVESSGLVETPNDLETELRRQIKNHIGEYAHLGRYRDGDINRSIREFFGKPRAEMSITELRAVLNYVKHTYDIGHVRGCGLRVPKQAREWHG